MDPLIAAAGVALLVVTLVSLAVPLGLVLWILIRAWRQIYGRRQPD